MALQRRAWAAAPLVGSVDAEDAAKLESESEPDAAMGIRAMCPRPGQRHQCTIAGATNLSLFAAWSGH